MLFPKSLFALLPLLSTIALSSPLVQQRQNESPILPDVTFTNDFPEVFYAGQTINLSWEGGDGFYALYRIQYTQGQVSVRPGYYTHNTTETSLTVTLDDRVFPNTTLNFGISEANPDANVEQKYQLSGAIPLIQA
ncbi:hypothetical protein I204_05843 [Kwoniella mangroviensis CBS 8886]|uniref:uncharacterized protein n=1 Tax=Kwoniella mangroviensis CBS 8507 TaxID=1296122 RepID=UPI00080D41C5|nr:uncharacterized protein I203_07817 [Kwoniella mangroviensis CBS 8507]OCF63081.1 hypothetical protein I203_07817 [Kwoniella mangroviensis CBS 8507]OCF73993.1 hypothetical protein I204_05843 [Kwoniella mangroviensis CBS 8886]